MGGSKPVIKVLDEHVALASSFRSVTPPIILVEEKMKCEHVDICLKTLSLSNLSLCLVFELYGLAIEFKQGSVVFVTMTIRCFTGSQPRVDSAAWFASAIGPNFKPRECTP